MKTTNAEQAVDTQLARIEALVAAKNDQVAVQALWAERVTAASVVEGTATTAKGTAD